MNNSIEVFDYPYKKLYYDLNNTVPRNTHKSFDAIRIFEYLLPRLDQFRNSSLNYIESYISNLTSDSILKEIFTRFLVNVKLSYAIA